MICKISEFIKISVQPDLSQGIQAAQDIAQPEQEQPQTDLNSLLTLVNIIKGLSENKSSKSDFMTVISDMLEEMKGKENEV